MRAPRDDGHPCTEAQFAAWVDASNGDPAQRAALIDALREEHPAYDGRGMAATARMRGWLLLSLAEPSLPDEAIVFALEPLDTGVEPYLVASAARALRRVERPFVALAPLLLKALRSIHYRDDRVDLGRYGGYAVGANGTTAVREILGTLEWMGTAASGSAAELRALAATNELGLTPGDRDTLALLAAKVGDALAHDTVADDDCCRLPWPFAGARRYADDARASAAPVENVEFEDQDGRRVCYTEFFRGRPTIVAFFYTRCDNPRKCSLTIAQLARVQDLLAARGLAGAVRVAAITYDPAFDRPPQLRSYGAARGFAFDDDRRLLRAPDGMAALRRHFGLGVNFVESVVSRHRIELYVLDADGRIAAAFERLQWDAADVVAKTEAVLRESAASPSTEASSESAAAASIPARAVAGSAGMAVLGGTGSVVAAFFPKCPVCWAAYMSLFGIAGLERLPYSPWLQPLFAALMLLNLYSLWVRARRSGSLLGFGIAAAGALVVLLFANGLGVAAAAPYGVALTLIGSILGVAGGTRRTAGAPRDVQ